MAPSTQIKPAGSYNNIGTDYVSPKEVGGDIDVLTAAAGTSFFTFDCNNASIEVDTIEEFTAGSGVTVDGVLLKDSWVTCPDRAYYSGNLAASSSENTAAFDIFKVDVSAHPNADVNELITPVNIAYTKANGRFTVTPAGVYAISVSVRHSESNLATDNFNAVTVSVQVNGSTVVYWRFPGMNAALTGNYGGAATAPVYIRSLTAGQYLNFLLTPYNSSSKTMAINNGTTVSIYRIA